MPRAVKPKPLISKLAEACDAVGGVPKKGHGEEFDYQRWADVAAAFRHELFSRGIVLLIEELEIDEKFFKNHAGLLYRYLRLKLEFTLTDESEKTIVRHAWGVGIDIGDKALYKAKTGATKYFLRGLGLIPDEADDPEADQAEAVAAETPRLKARVEEFQTRAWTAALKQGGRTERQAISYLQTRFAGLGPTQLTKEEFDEALRWALGREELDKSLQLSVEAQKQNGKDAH